MIEVLTVIAAIAEIGGIYFLGQKQKIGFVLGSISGVLWIAYTLITGNAIGLLVVCSVTMVLNGRGFFKWKKEEKR
jgi:nicotinamide riboside transporter PnuC